MIQAKVIADSKNEFGNRITTMVITFPRIILAEFNTHRMFSRNSASSRAIPFEKMLKSVEENPFIPIAWQKDHKGMQGTEYLTAPIDLAYANDIWLEARDRAVKSAKALNKGSKVTKQLCNRLLEPFMYHTIIVTGTEWENFFALRCPKYDINIKGENKSFRSWKDYTRTKAVDSLLPIETSDLIPSVLDKLKVNIGQAEIHMMSLAEAMWDAYNGSIPKELKDGDWHIPFFDNEYSELTKVIDLEQTQGKTPQQVAIMIATARCARVSYTIVGEKGKEPNYENDIKLHDRLAESGHWSPFEHCARASNYRLQELKYFVGGFSGNFKGFVQYRKMFNNENITV